MVGHPAGGAAVLAAFVLLVFHDGFWGIPRSDQLVYLYDAARFPRFVDLLVRAPVWERSVGVGDYLLFRPILQLLLALEYGLFGYRFMLWQAVGVGLHVAVSIALWRLFRRAAPAAWGLSLVAAALFASLLVSAEAVVWHHISGYLLFDLCLISSLLALLRYLDAGRRHSADAAVALAAVAAFTYELGNVYCLLVAGGLAVSALRPGTVSGAGQPDVRARRLLALAFAAVPVAYVTISLTDFYLRFGHVPRPGTGTAVGLGLAFTARQLGFWLGGAFLPAVYDITWGGGRSVFEGYRWGADTPILANLAAVAATLAGVLGGALTARRRPGGAALAQAAIAATLLVAYSAIIAFGRSVPRGYDNTMDVNLHHAYTAVTLAAAATALALAGSVPIGNLPPSRGVAVWRGTLVAGLAGLTVINAGATMGLLSDYRHEYAARVMEILHHARRWHETRAPDDYFRVKEGCPGNQRLTWFGLYLKHDADRVHVLDVLYPATSALLHRAETERPGARVTPLACTDGRVEPRTLLGAWRARGGAPFGRVAPDGRVELVDERGASSGVAAEGRLLFAGSWKIAGLLSHDDRYIFWSDGRTWRR